MEAAVGVEEDAQEQLQELGAVLRLHPPVVVVVGVVVVGRMQRSPVVLLLHAPLPGYCMGMSRRQHAHSHIHPSIHPSIHRFMHP